MPWKFKQHIFPRKWCQVWRNRSQRLSFPRLPGANAASRLGNTIVFSKDFKQRTHSGNPASRIPAFPAPKRRAATSSTSKSYCNGFLTVIISSVIPKSNSFHLAIGAPSNGGCPPNGVNMHHFQRHIPALTHKCRNVTSGIAPEENKYRGVGPQ